MSRGSSAARKLADVRADLSQLRYGDHTCPIYRSDEEQVSVAVSFLNNGFAANDRCMYVASRDVLDRLQQALAQAGTDVDAEIARGRLMLRDETEAHLRTGRFSGDAMLELLTAAERDAIKGGFAGLRYACEMGWALDACGDKELIAYEARINRFIKNRRVIILCQFDRRRFNASVIHDLIRTHPVVMIGHDIYANPYYEPPELLLSHGTEPRDDVSHERVEWWINALRSARETELRREFAEGLVNELEQERIRAVARARDMAARMYALVEIAGGVVVAETPEQLRAILVEACQRVISFDALIISLYDEPTHSFHFFGAWDEDVYSTPAVVPAAGTPGERVVRERRTLITHRSTDPEAAGARLTGTRKRSESVIRAPLLAGDKVIGMLSVHSYTPDLYQAEDGRVVEAVAALATAAIERIQSHAERRAEKQRRKTAEENLRQAQKLEAIGQLAGGVAHDFNNLLVAIGGYAQLALDELDGEHPARQDLLEVMNNVQRATTLTRQLLVFGRKQMLNPRRMRLADTIHDTEKLLRRLIGADITLDVEIDNECEVHADPGQIEQVIVNLVVNSRDAMPRGGTIRICADTVDCAEGRAVGNCSPPGRYARLSVIDTGHGMDAATREHIFEPFFTTKPAGSGTGLGLSTVYGIVKQSGGFIEVQSEPGAGTRVDVLLPCSAAPAA